MHKTVVLRHENSVRKKENSPEILHNFDSRISQRMLHNFLTGDIARKTFLLTKAKNTIGRTCKKREVLKKTGIEKL